MRKSFNLISQRAQEDYCLRGTEAKSGYDFPHRARAAFFAIADRFFGRSAAQLPERDRSRILPRLLQRRAIQVFADGLLANADRRARDAMIFA